MVPTQLRAARFRGSIAVNHASAVAVTVDARASGSDLHITVRDDGVGGADFSRGSGLVGVKDRVEALSGRVRLDSRCGAGTVLRAELPLTIAHGAALHHPPEASDSPPHPTR
jgi:glucose-6-phosphate-specific signal transduction histidine kinase